MFVTRLYKKNTEQQGSSKQPNKDTDMLAVLVSTLSLISLSRSAPLACDQLLRPSVQLDPLDLVGRWALVAGSLKNPAAESLLRKRDSIAFDLSNSSYTQANFQDDGCQYDPQDVTVEGHVLKMRRNEYNFTVTFYHTSCSDCALFTLDVESCNYRTVDFYLVSKRRQLDTELEEFRTQVECLNMPPPVVMDPAKDLCPEQERKESRHRRTEW